MEKNRKYWVIGAFLIIGLFLFFIVYLEIAKKGFENCSLSCDDTTENIRISRICLNNSCNSDYCDAACCIKNSCVSNGICYSRSEYIEFGSSGNALTCINDTNSYGWIDSDKDNKICNLLGFSWLYSNDKMFFGFFGNDSLGFCCGDDKNEKAVECGGFLCNKDKKTACCNDNQCSYNGKCYDSGCNSVKDGQNPIKAYCDSKTNKWIDLDDSYCGYCLGSKHEANNICCGDDFRESSIPSNFVYNQSGIAISSKYFGCSDSKNECILPYFDGSFKDECYYLNYYTLDLDGYYYCKNGIWNNPDLNADTCKKCNLNWLDRTDGSFCCGDDTSEFYIEGDDKTDACCSNKNSCVKNWSCVKCNSCGNSVLDINEECDYSTENEKCLQESESCAGKKIGKRDGYGLCDSFCNCIYDEFNYSCIKGSCGAGCNDDGSGCSSNQYCDTNTCSCYNKSHNKDDIELEKNCPFRLEMFFDKENYLLGETQNFLIRLLDKFNNPMQSAKIFVEFYIDDDFKNMEIYLTDKKGIVQIKRMITGYLEPGIYEYIAKARVDGCEILAGSDYSIVEFKRNATKAYKVSKTKKISSASIKNLTRAFPEIRIDSGYCGDGMLNIGEVCESSSVCRSSYGCNYQNHTYDIPERCAECYCKEDLWSNSNDKSYCDNCNHCGDGIINCNEECESDDTKESVFCISGAIYSQKSHCNNCTWLKNYTNEVILEKCSCDCSKINPNETCENGDYIQYEDYNPGCDNLSCNRCDCNDAYKKDTNNDGIEDKCGPEICINNIDDNDNGLIDEKDCIWQICSSCGHGLINFCDKKECLAYKEGCFFDSVLVDYGFCASCSSLSSCEDYSYSKQNCLDDSCNIKNCYFDDGICCTDYDEDKICDNNDNCKDVFNPSQKDSDNDGYGDDCDLCKNEPKLRKPDNTNETYCSDKTDNDCDDALDCEDLDCSDICLQNISQSYILKNDSEDNR